MQFKIFHIIVLLLCLSLSLLHSVEKKEGFVLRESPNGTELITKVPAESFTIILYDIEEEKGAPDWWQIGIVLPPEKGSKVSNIVSGYMSETNIKKYFNADNKDENGNFFYAAPGAKAPPKAVLVKPLIHPPSENEQKPTTKVSVVDEATGNSSLIPSDTPVELVGKHSNGWAYSLKLPDGRVVYTGPANFKHLSNLKEQGEEEDYKIPTVDVVVWNSKDKSIGKSYKIPRETPVEIKKNPDGFGFIVKPKEGFDNKRHGIPEGVVLVTSQKNIEMFSNSALQVKPNLPGTTQPSNGAGPSRSQIIGKHTGFVANTSTQKKMKTFVETDPGTETSSFYGNTKSVADTCSTSLDGEIVKLLKTFDGTCSKEMVALVKATIMQESKWDQDAYRYESALHEQDWALNYFIPFKSDRGINKRLTPSHPLRKKFFASYGLMQVLTPTPYGNAIQAKAKGTATPEQLKVLEPGFDPLTLVEPKTNLYHGMQYLMSHVKKARKAYPKEWQLAAAAGYNTGQTGAYGRAHKDGKGVRYHYNVQNYYKQYLACSNAGSICSK